MTTANIGLIIGFVLMALSAILFALEAYHYKARAQGLAHQIMQLQRQNAELILSDRKLIEEGIDSMEAAKAFTDPKLGKAFIIPFKKEKS